MNPRWTALTLSIPLLISSACGSDGEAEDDAGTSGADAGGDPGSDVEVDAVTPDTPPDDLEAELDTGPGDGDEVTDEPEVEPDIEPDVIVDPDLGPPPAVGDLRVVGGVDLRALERRGVALGALNFSGVSHVVVGHLELAADGTCGLADPGDDARVASLIQDGGPDVIVSVGGFGMASEYFKDVAADAGARERFASTCATLVHDLGVTGLEVNWSTPIIGGWYGPGRTDDWANYVLLLDATRAALDAIAAGGDRYELSFFGPGDLLVVPPASLEAAVAVADTVSVLTFDFTGAWDLSRTGFASSLFAPSGYSVDLVVSAWADTGADVTKLVIGVPLYGWGWAGVGPVDNGRFQVPTGPATGTGSESGLFAYGALEPIPDGFSRFFDEERRVPWLYSATDEVFITYEDRTSVAEKAAFVVERGLRGVLGWDLSLETEGVILPAAARVFEEALAEGSEGSGG